MKVLQHSTLFGKKNIQLEWTESGYKNWTNKALKQVQISWLVSTNHSAVEQSNLMHEKEALL